MASIPGTPPFIAGVVRVREEIHSVFDLRALLGGQRQAITNDAKIIALGEQRIEFCLLADDVAGITAIAASDIHTRNSDRERDGKNFIRGVTNDAILVLDTVALLRDPNLYIGSDATRS
jgi:purine-binding chemotaxis protein CheW